MKWTPGLSRRCCLRRRLPKRWSRPGRRGRACLCHHFSPCLSPKMTVVPAKGSTPVPGRTGNQRHGRGCADPQKPYNSHHRSGQVCGLVRDHKQRKQRPVSRGSGHERRSAAQRIPLSPEQGDAAALSSDHPPGLCRVSLSASRVPFSVRDVPVITASSTGRSPSWLLQPVLPSELTLKQFSPFPQHRAAPTGEIFIPISRTP